MKVFPTQVTFTINLITFIKTIEDMWNLEATHNLKEHIWQHHPKLLTVIQLFSIIKQEEDLMWTNLSHSMVVLQPIHADWSLKVSSTILLSSIRSMPTVILTPQQRNSLTKATSLGKVTSSTSSSMPRIVPYPLARPGNKSNGPMSKTVISL